MACDAIARLYDVNEKTVVFRKIEKSKSYDEGTFSFRARKGKLIDLDKLHESVWATRLSGGTRSGLVSLQVTTVGRLVTTEDKTILHVDGSDAQFVLERKSGDESAAVFDKLKAIPNDKIVTITGVIAEYRGRWPELLRKRPQNPRRILVTEITEAKDP